MAAPVARAWMWIDADGAACPSLQASVLAAVTPTKAADQARGISDGDDIDVARLAQAAAIASSTMRSSVCKRAREAISGTTPPYLACRSYCVVMRLQRTPAAVFPPRRRRSITRGLDSRDTSQRLQAGLGLMESSGVFGGVVATGLQILEGVGRARSRPLR